jgi:hypothetical protein
MTRSALVGIAVAAATLMACASAYELALRMLPLAS